jgi:hypothetical protein
MCNKILQYSIIERCVRTACANIFLIYFGENKCLCLFFYPVMEREQN